MGRCCFYKGMGARVLVMGWRLEGDARVIGLC